MVNADIGSKILYSASLPSEDKLMRLPFTTEWYKARLTHSYPDARIRAIEILLKRKGADKVDLLIPLLNDENHRVRKVASENLKTLSKFISLATLISFANSNILIWEDRKTVIELAVQCSKEGNELLHRIFQKLWSTVASIPNKSYPEEHYVFRFIQTAFEYEQEGYDFEVSFTPATYKIGKVEMSYKLIDSHHEQSNYGSGHPNWDSISQTYQYEDGHIEVLSYEGMGVPYLGSVPTRYKDGQIIDQWEIFEIRRGKRLEI